MLISQLKLSADRQTDRGTPVKQYGPNLSMGGHKKSQSFVLQINAVSVYIQIKLHKMYSLIFDLH